MPLFVMPRLRTLEISQVFPIIDQAYQLKTKRQQQEMKVSLICISLLSVFLLVAIFFVYKQMKKVAAARRESGRYQYVVARTERRTSRLQLATERDEPYAFGRHYIEGGIYRRIWTNAPLISTRWIYTVVP